MTETGVISDIVFALGLPYRNGNKPSAWVSPSGTYRVLTSDGGSLPLAMDRLLIMPLLGQAREDLNEKRLPAKEIATWCGKNWRPGKLEVRFKRLLSIRIERLVNGEWRRYRIADWWEWRDNELRICFSLEFQRSARDGCEFPLAHLHALGTKMCALDVYFFGCWALHQRRFRNSWEPFRVLYGAGENWLISSELRKRVQEIKRVVKNWPFEVNKRFLVCPFKAYLLHAFGIDLDALKAALLAEVKDMNRAEFRAYADQQPESRRLMLMAVYMDGCMVPEAMERASWPLLAVPDLAGASRLFLAGIESLAAKLGPRVGSEAIFDAALAIGERVAIALESGGAAEASPTKAGGHIEPEAERPGAADEVAVMEPSTSAETTTEAERQGQAAEAEPITAAGSTGAPRSRRRRAPRRPRGWRGLVNGAVRSIRHRRPARPRRRPRQATRLQRFVHGVRARVARLPGAGLVGARARRETDAVPGAEQTTPRGRARRALGRAAGFVRRTLSRQPAPAEVRRFTPDEMATLVAALGILGQGRRGSSLSAAELATLKAGLGIVQGRESPRRRVAERLGQRMRAAASEVLARRARPRVGKRWGLLGRLRGRGRGDELDG